MNTKLIYAVAWLAFMPATFSMPVYAATHRVTISQVAFQPAEIKAAIGDTIEWTNADFVTHTATGKDGEFDLNLPKGAKKSAMVTKAGTINYYCRFHPNMHGKISVVEK